jgi:hypothetical protein
MEEWQDSITNYQPLLEDDTVIRTFEQLIEKEPELFKNKVVLDVNSGLGIISMLIAKAGAKRVYSVEESNIVTASHKLIKENGLEKQIEIINKPINELELTEKVDIIISNWFGFYLFHGRLCESVLYARDNYLKLDGIIIPEKATLKLALYEETFSPFHQKAKVFYNDNFHGINLKSLYQDALEEYFPDRLLVQTGEEKKISTNIIEKSFDFYKISPEEIQSFNVPLKFTSNKNCRISSVVIWFDVNLYKNIIFQTGINDKVKLFKQSYLVFANSFDLHKDVELEGTLEFKVDEYSPFYYLIFKTNYLDLDIEHIVSSEHVLELE